MSIGLIHVAQANLSKNFSPFAETYLLPVAIEDKDALERLNYPGELSPKV